MEPGTLEDTTAAAGTEAESIPADTLWRTRKVLQPDLERRKNPAYQSFGGFTFVHQGPPIDEADVDLWIHDVVTGPGDPEHKRWMQSEYETHRRRRGEKPFQYLELARERKRAADLRAKVPVLDTIFSGPAGFKAALEKEKYLDLQWKIRNSLDPELEKQKIANRMLYAAATGKEADDELWPVQRERYAREVLGWTGAQAIDERAFHGLAGKMLDRQRGDLERSEQVYKQARMMAMRAQPMDDAVKETGPMTGGRAREFEPMVRAAYAEVYSAWSDDEIYAGRALFEKLAEMEGEDVAGHVIGDFRDPAWVLGLRTYGRADQASRDRIMGLIASQAGVEGKDLEAYLMRVAEAFESGLERLGSGVNAYGWRGEAERVDGWAKEESDPQRRKALEDHAAFARGNASFPIDLRTAGVRVVRFLDEDRKGFWDSLDDYTLMAVESSPSLAVASLPYGAGLPLLAADYHAEELSRLRRAHPGVPEERLSKIAIGPALLSAGTDRLQALLFAKLPNASAVLGKVLPKPLAITGAVLGNATVQTGQEVGQSLLLPAAEEIAAALDKDIKGPDWHEVLKREQEALGDYFGTSLVISLVAAAGGSIAGHTDRAELAKTLQDRHALELAGFDAAAVDAVVAMAGSDPQRAAELLHASWQETGMEKRRENARAKRGMLEEMVAGQLARPEQQPENGGGARSSEVEEGTGGAEEVDTSPAFDEGLVNRAVEEAVARGNMANTDEVRSLIPGYNEADPLTRDSEYHRQASALNDRVIARLLEREPVTRSAVLLAGGAGSGKSAVLKRLDVPRDLAIDTTLSWEDSARQIAADIEASGRTPIVLYVHRPFAKAFEDGVIGRYLKGKKNGVPRLVPLQVAAAAHVGAQETVIALAAGGVDVSVFDNSGRAGEFVERDIEFIKGNRYTTANEGRRTSGSGTTTETDRGRVESSTFESDGGSAGADQAGLRRRAEELLIAEGDAILERYRREGKLTDAEVRAFRGEGDRPEGSPGDGGSTPPEGGGSEPRPSNRPGASPSSSDVPRMEESASPPAIRELTSLSTGQSVHVLELPDGTRSEHATREEAQDAYDTWEAEQEYEDWIGERLSKTRKKAKDMGGAGDRAIGDKIVERLMRKSFAVRGKGPVRKALFGERLAMTPEEIRTLQSPVEILLRYTPEGMFHSARRGSRVDHDSPAMIKEGEIFCHNHPGGRGPSDGDLKFALENPTCTVRVVTGVPNGRMAVYEIRASGRADADAILDIKEFYRSECQRRNDDADARDKAIGLMILKFGDFISVRKAQL
jgi:hypothetical protein